MKRTWICVISLFLISTATALASNVGVVDSGTYFAHDWMKMHTWTNPAETAGDMIDNDRNGKVDDVNGWNFAENYWKVFYPEHIQRVHPMTYRIFNILSALEMGTATDNDKEFIQKNFKNLPDAEKTKVRAHLNFYGQYAHSTHVSGIIAQNPSAKIMSARIFPDQPPEQLEVKIGGVTLRPEDLMEGDPANAAKSHNLLYMLLAASSNKTFFEVAKYISEQKMDIANMSIGMALPMIAKAWLGIKGKKNPTEEEVSRETWKLFSNFKVKGDQWLALAPKTLFVIAAGNDGTNNDKLPGFPANLIADNSITVAATKGYGELASFSNYGATSVQVAAPGVAIMSSVPGPTTSQVLPMSGTSMATPYVAMIASAVKDSNPKLDPKAIKAVLMGTVDKKGWLTGKVVSGGVVNAERALRAAELSRTIPYAEAIDLSRTQVADVAEPVKGPKLMSAYDDELMDLAESFVF